MFTAFLNKKLEERSMAEIEKLTKKEELELEKEKELIMTEEDIISILAEERPLPTRDVLIDRLGIVIT